MGYIQGGGRRQGTLFPAVLDDLVSADHMCRVINAFVEQLDMEGLGFERAQAAETGRPSYDPRDLLKLYLYGYLNQIRTSRRLEAECRRNVELMWLLREMVTRREMTLKGRLWSKRQTDAFSLGSFPLSRLGRPASVVCPASVR